MHQIHTTRHGQNVRTGRQLGHHPARPPAPVLVDELDGVAPGGSGRRPEPAVRAGADHAGADPARSLSRAECEAIFHKVVGLIRGGGETVVTIRLVAQEYVTWARNRPTMIGADRSVRVIIERIQGSARAVTETNKLNDASLQAALAQAETRLKEQPTDPNAPPIQLLEAQQYASPPLWSDTTFALSDDARSMAARQGAETARAAQLLAAGTLETRAATWAIFNTAGLAAYAVGTAAQYAETVRDPAGTASGWAGLMQTDWTKLDPAALAAVAQRKCVASAHPRALEPGRYTTILEPQAVGAFMAHAVREMDRASAEQGDHAYAGRTRGTTKLGERILDERITITSDPMDPEAPYMPFASSGEPYRPVTWVERGVLKNLAYDSAYAKRKLGGASPLLNATAFRMSGGETSLEEMIASTERGVLVTRFGPAALEHPKSLLVSTVTRDGLWLVEKGKITAAAKNMRVLASSLFVGTSVLQLGKPERIFGSYWRSTVTWFGTLNYEDVYTSMALGNIPVVVPPMKVRDFNFVALADAV